MAVMFGLGYYLLNHVSTMEDPVLGNTFYIVFGCIFMAIPVVISIKLISDKTKRKRRSSSGSSRQSSRSTSKRIFLEDQKSGEN